MSRESEVKRYFTKTPTKPVPLPPDRSSLGCIVLGAFVSLGGLAVLLLFSLRVDIFRFAGIPFIVVGILLLIMGLLYSRSIQNENDQAFQEKMETYEADYKKAEPKPTDAQIDEWFEADMEALKEGALVRLGLDGEDEDDLQLYTIYGLVPGTAAHICDDNKIRFSDYEVWLIHLAKSGMFLYTARYNLATGLKDLGDRHAMRISDFVSMSHIYEESLELTIDGDPLAINRFNRFNLKFLSGETISIPTLDGKLYIREGKTLDVDLNANQEGEVEAEAQEEAIWIHGERVPVGEIVGIVDIPPSGAREAFLALEKVLER